MRLRNHITTKKKHLFLDISASQPAKENYYVSFPKVFLNSLLKVWKKLRTNVYRFSHWYRNILTSRRFLKALSFINV